jgi:thioredoxin 1
MMSSFNDIINKDKPVLVDFFATWCGPCQTMTPILKEVKEDLGDNVKIIKIDVDKNKALATKFQVRGVPTFMIFKNGKQVWRQAGLITKNELKQKISNA